MAAPERFAQSQIPLAPRDEAGSAAVDKCQLMPAVGAIEGTRLRLPAACALVVAPAAFVVRLASVMGIIPPFRSLGLCQPIEAP
jgi:hypothetical protein